MSRRSSAKAKVVHDYGDAIATLRATTSGATLAYGGLSESALLTLVKLDDSRVALSVSAGNSLQGGTEYRLSGDADGVRRELSVGGL